MALSLAESRMDAESPEVREGTVVRNRDLRSQASSGYGKPGGFSQTKSFRFQKRAVKGVEIGDGP